MRARSAFLTLCFLFVGSAAAFANPCTLPFTGAGSGSAMPVTGAPGVSVFPTAANDQMYACSNQIGQPGTVGDLTPAAQRGVTLSRQMCASNCAYQALDASDPNSTLVPYTCWNPSKGPSTAQMFAMPMLMPLAALSMVPAPVGGCQSSNVLPAAGAPPGFMPAGPIRP